MPAKSTVKKVDTDRYRGAKEPSTFLMITATRRESEHNMSEPFLEYSEASHRYYVNGREVPSVTAIIKSAGLMSEFAMDADAALRGTEVHRYCAMSDTDGVHLQQVPARFRGYIKAWRQYQKDAGFACIEVERRVDDPNFEYAGRLDRVGLRGMNSIKTLLDIKTGVVPDWAKYQLVAYGAAYLVRPGQVCERAAVQLKPDGTYKVRTWPLSEFYQDLAAFRQMLANYNTKQEIS